MSWTISVSPQAEKYYLRLDKPTRARVKEGLKELAQCANPADNSNVKPLTGELRGFYRLRIGDYRIVFSLLREEQLIAVVNISPRGDAYK
ncbi:MAG: type II toxin-antitoxin system RelE/ParE family toxin [Thermodesulfovibrionales bacterium]